tara:strand:- start:3115 stop:3315 length:201 start_codon:yes stop_codon:yes gene_type:complete
MTLLKVDYGYDIDMEILDDKDMVCLKITGFDNDIERQEFGALLMTAIHFDKLYFSKLFRTSEETLH